MPVAPALLMNVIADSLAILILSYIVFSLVRADKDYVKENILQKYELMKRDKVFRKSLGILAVSLAFALAATIWTIYSSEERQIINAFQFISGLFRVLFFVYLLSAVRVTKH